MSTTRPLTVEQFEALPDEITERHELVDGKLVPLPSSTPRNSLIRDDLRSLLDARLRQRKAGLAICEVDVRTSARNVRRPDISIFSPDQTNRLDLDSVRVIRQSRRVS